MLQYNAFIKIVAKKQRGISSCTVKLLLEILYSLILPKTGSIWLIPFRLNSKEESDSLEPVP